jgi:hypothetical protein
VKRALCIAGLLLIAAAVLLRGQTGVQTIPPGGNCAVNTVSPAACGAAPSGSIAIPTTTTTYTVNTSAVTANSRIFLQEKTDNTGLPSAPTCTQPAITGSAFYGVSGRVAATSFTMYLPSTGGTTCFDYWIVN